MSFLLLSFDYIIKTRNLLFNEIYDGTQVFCLVSALLTSSVSALLVCGELSVEDDSLDVESFFNGALST